MEQKFGVMMGKSAYIYQSYHACRERSSVLVCAGFVLGKYVASPVPAKAEQQLDGAGTELARKSINAGIPLPAPSRGAS